MINWLKMIYIEIKMAYRKIMMFIWTVIVKGSIYFLICNNHND